MINLYKKEIKAKDNISEIIDVEITHYKINETSSKLLKLKKKEIEYIKSDEVIKFINTFFKNISNSLEIEISVTVLKNENFYDIKLDCEDNSILIGKDGNTLKSMQLLIHQIINNLTGFNLRFNIDCSDYKLKRIKRLELEIAKICKEVNSTKINAKLDPMNSYERRIVHNIVGEYKNLKTLSEGVEPNRYVVINYKED